MLRSGHETSRGQWENGLRDHWHMDGEQWTGKLEDSWLTCLILWSKGHEGMSTLYTREGLAYYSPQIWSAACFCKWGFTETQLHSLIYILSMAVFVLQWQSWVVTTENIWPTKPEIFPMWLSAVPCSRRMQAKQHHLIYARIQLMQETGEPFDVHSSWGYGVEENACHRWWFQKTRGMYFELGKGEQE